MPIPDKPTAGRPGIRLVIKGASIFVLLTVIALVAKQLDFDELFSKFGAAGNHPDTPWYYGKAGFVVFAGSLAALAVPRQIISFFAAFLFGLWPGLGLALGATLLGCVLDYLAGKVFKKHVSDLIFGKIQVAVKFWKENPFSLSLVIRLLPAGSNFATSLAAGAAGITPLPFFAGSLLGYIPQTLVFGLMGSGINVNSGTQILLSAILFACSAMLGLWLFRRNRKILSTPASDGS